MAFLKRLPAQLSVTEVQLRNLLQATATLAEGVIADSTVSLQEWIEARIPGEVILKTNAAGYIILRPKEAQKEATPDRGADTTKVTKFVAKAKAAARRSEVGTKPEDFLATLPSESFLPEEDNLRDALTNALLKGPMRASKVSGAVASLTKAFLTPHGVDLIDWIQMRIGEEVVLTMDGDDVICDLARSGSDPLPKEDLRKSDFLLNLPVDGFTEAEEALRNALFDFLATWKSPELATLTHLGQCPTVAKAKAALLPPGITLRQWIEHRIGGEIELREDAKKQHVIHLLEPARNIVTARYAEIEREARARLHDGELARESFFSSLPQHELLPGEADLRHALISFHKAWPANARGKDPKWPPLSVAGSSAEVHRAKQALLPKGVSLNSWIEYRIGAEITTRAGSDKQMEYCVIESDAQREQRMAQIQESKDDFFKSLPADGFTQEEEALRETVLGFLDQWRGPGAAAMSSLGSCPSVVKAKSFVLPKPKSHTGGPAVSLKEWIERRIGGEVEIWKSDSAGETFVCLQGQRAELQEGSDSSKKRKEPEGKGKGKGKKGKEPPAKRQR